MSTSESAADDGDWVSWVQAAAIIGCSPGTVKALVKTGRLSTRPRQGRLPSVELSSAQALAVGDAWRARPRRNRGKRRRQRGTPPDNNSVWLGAVTAGLVMGVSTERVRQRARAGTLPVVVHGGQMWFRREHVEQAAAARTFALAQRAARRTTQADPSQDQRRHSPPPVY